MTHVWLLAQWRQLACTSFSRFLVELLSAKNFVLDREVAGEMLRVPRWEHCLDYEFQIRNEAMKLVRIKGYPIRAELSAAYHDQAHRMEHWITLLTICFARYSSSSSL